MFRARKRSILLMDLAQRDHFAVTADIGSMNPRALRDPPPPACPLSNSQIIEAVLKVLSVACLHAGTSGAVAAAVLGLVHSPRLSVTAIGTALARVTGGRAKHGVKQVDRLLSNAGCTMEDCLRAYVRAVLGNRKSIMVALDWTEFALDGHSTICLSLVTNHGRATPLVWMTVETASLKGKRNHHEDDLLWLFKRCLPDDREMTVVVLADRGFGDVALYAELEEKLGFDFVIRFRSNVTVEHQDVSKRADQWLADADGKRVTLHEPLLTWSRRKVATFVAVKEPGMKEAWFLASSLRASARSLIQIYARRFTIEETFRDQKDARFGWGLYDTQVTQTARRDRLLLLAALAQMILTMVGAAGEKLGLDRDLRVNTAQKRTHSLFRQGREYIKGLVEHAALQVREIFVRMSETLTFNTDSFAPI